MFAAAIASTSKRLVHAIGFIKLHFPPKVNRKQRKPRRPLSPPESRLKDSLPVVESMIL
jgi:hypothetical protein